MSFGRRRFVVGLFSAMAKFLLASSLAGTALGLTACKSQIDKHYSAAKDLEKKGQYEEAEAEYLALFQLDPNHIKGHFNLAKMYKEEMKETEKSLAQYREVVRLDPQYARAWTSIIDLHFEKGDVDEAVKAAEASLEADAFNDKPDLKDQVVLRIEEMKKSKIAMQKNAAAPGAPSPAAAPAPTPESTPAATPTPTAAATPAVAETPAL